MIPRRLPETNLTLTAPAGQEGQVGDLPAVRGEDENDYPLIQTAWEPDDGELRALNNGAAVLVRIWTSGSLHPMKVLAGDPDPTAARPQIDTAHTVRALGHLHAALSDRANNVDVGYPEEVGPSDGVPPPDELLTMWQRALQATRHPETGADTETPAELADQLNAGVCKDCGCTDTDPCTRPPDAIGAETVNACAWTDDTRTECTACATGRAHGWRNPRRDHRQAP